MDVELKGILSIQYTARSHYSRLRVIFYGVSHPPPLVHFLLASCTRHALQDIPLCTADAPLRLLPVPFVWLVRPVLDLCEILGAYMPCGGRGGTRRFR